MRETLADVTRTFIFSSATIATHTHFVTTQGGNSRVIYTIEYSNQAHGVYLQRVDEIVSTPHVQEHKL